MADTQVLGTCDFGRVGSSPTSRTNIFSRLSNLYDLVLIFFVKSFTTILFIPIICSRA